MSMTRLEQKRRKVLKELNELEELEYKAYLKKFERIETSENSKTGIWYKDFIDEDTNKVFSIEIREKIFRHPKWTMETLTEITEYYYEL